MKKDRASIERRATYSALSAVFLAIFAAFASLQKVRGKKYSPSALEMAELAFASYRLGRMVAYDKVFETYRLPFARTVPDPSGAGETTTARGRGAREAIGELLTCPICVGTWISAGLVYFVNLFPEAGRTLLTITSAIGAAEFLNAATEAFQWTGQVEREEVGAMEMTKREEE